MPECLFCQSNLSVLLSLFIYFFCVLKMKILLLKFYYYFKNIFIGVCEATEQHTHSCFAMVLLVSAAQQGESATHTHTSPLISISSTLKSSEHRGAFPMLYSRFSLVSWYESESVSCSVRSDCLQLHGLEPTRLLCPWNSPGQNTGVGSCSLLQGIFSPQGSNPGLAHCRGILYCLSHQGSP